MSILIKAVYHFSNLKYIVAYLLKTIIGEKQPLLCNDCAKCNNGVTVGSNVFCAVHTEAV
jgi:hypothetical protein